MNGTAITWLRVSRKRPCSICGKPDWCTFTADGRLVCCMRTQSDRPAHNVMGGWLHRLDGGKQAAWRQEERTAPAQHPPTANLAQRYAQWASRTGAELRRTHAEALGVSPQALAALEVAWAPEHRAWSSSKGRFVLLPAAWAWPMVDVERNLVGIRLRTESGEKFAEPGSQVGLFWSRGVPGDQTDTLLICEGPTDTAALMGLGYDAIGRHSCTGGMEMLAELFSRDRRHAVIVADDDAPKPRPDGTTWKPGQEGAERLAHALHGIARSVRIVYPLGAKDAREWVRQGATHADVEMVINNALYYRG